MKNVSQAVPVALATYRGITTYEPKFADLVIRCTWLRTYFGVVNSYNKAERTIGLIMEGTPKLLFTMTKDEMDNAEILVKLDDVRNGKKGSWSACQQIDGQAVWYI